MASTHVLASDWELAVSGDRASIEAIIVKHMSRAVSGANRVSITATSGLASDQSDAAQQALLYAWECFVGGAFADMTEDQFASWLYRSAMNRSRKLIEKSRWAKRDARRTETLGDVAIEDSAHGADYRAELNEQLAMVYDLFSDHSVRSAQCRTVLDGLLESKTAGEIAAGLGLTEMQVRKRIRFIRDKAAALKT